MSFHFVALVLTGLLSALGLVGNNGLHPLDVEIADVDGDGLLDLATLLTGIEVSVLLGKGAGALVDGGVTLARRWGSPPLVVVLTILLRTRPDVVVSTGAAPGYFALRIGKMLGARTIWVDSIANVDELSLSGQLVKAYADMWLTQWPHLAKPGGPECHGAVL